MKSLYEVLQDSKLIIKTVQQFGFTDNVKIYCGDNVTADENVITLRLVISHDKEKTSIPWDRTVLLQAKLTEVLSCQVDLTHIEACSEPTAYGILSLSAPITEEGEICKLFEVKSTKAIFIENAEKASQRLVDAANEYLLKASYDDKKLSNVSEALSKHAVVCETVQKKQRRELEDAREHHNGNTASDSKTPSPNK